MSLALVVALAFGAVGVAFWTYLRREPPVRGRIVLALLRAATLVLLILLLWNPGMPFGIGGEEVAAPTVLVDASLSMTAVDSSGASSWEAAVERTEELVGPAGRVLLFGSSARLLSADSMLDHGPGDLGSRLAPALERVAALGGSSVRVLSDFRLEDPVAVSAALEETGLGVRFEDVDGTRRNAGLGEVRAPASLDAGEPGVVDVLLAGEGGSGADSVSLELRADDRLLAARRVPLPSAGRPERHRLEFSAPEERGSHRLQIDADLSGDGFSPDDRRLLFLEVDPIRAGLVLLSLRPDWEPRYLLPVLEQVTGLDARGFLRLSGGRWLPMGREEERTGVLDEERLREVAAEAGFVVLHGVGEGTPPWVRELASTTERLLLFPEGPAAADLADVAVGEWEEAEWYAEDDLPASPLSGELAGTSLEDLPPLTALLPLTGDPPPGRAPLVLRRSQQGPPRPALLLAPGGDERRAVVALASGFWRWAAREGTPREAYRRLWSAVAGWLLEGPSGEMVAGVAPAERPVGRGDEVEWRARGSVGDTFEIRVETDDSTVLDTTVVRSGSTARTRSLPPGRYRYRVEASNLDEAAAGELEVSGYSDELLRARVEPPGAPSADADGRSDRRPARALRTHPAPYLFLILLLSAEWIGRRRQGLR